jgi:tRNA dimethylallyltransferase
LYIGLTEESETLYKKINLRVDQMIEDGFIGEVKDLVAKGYSLKDKALNSIGYAELIKYLNNEISFEEAVRQIKKESRRYAKRQITWFKRNKKINWFNSSELYKIKAVVKKWIPIKD